MIAKAAETGSGSGGPRSGGSIVSSQPQTVTNKDAIAARKDPNEEFFKMTFCAYRFNNTNYEKLLTVSLKMLNENRSMLANYMLKYKRAMFLLTRCPNG